MVGGAAADADAGAAADAGDGDAGDGGLYRKFRTRVRRRIQQVKNTNN